MDLEQRIGRFRDAGDLRGAATTAIEGYGPEVLGFLITFLRDEDAASEVFSQACEDLWAGLARFEGRSSLRTWFYTIARHAASRFRRSPERARRRRLPISEMADLAEAVRSRTLPHLRSEVKARFAAIRDSLDEEDRTLLVLRVDRDLSFRDIAQICAGNDCSDAELVRVAARLRKRFQLVKEEIRERARAAGLLAEDEP